MALRSDDLSTGTWVGRSRHDLVAEHDRRRARRTRRRLGIWLTTLVMGAVIGGGAAFAEPGSQAGTTIMDTNPLLGRLVGGEDAVRISEGR